MEKHKGALKRAETLETWYSLSYLYLSTFATLLVIIVGLVVSILTGGRKAQVGTDLLLKRTDFLCYFPRSSSGDRTEIVDCTPCSDTEIGNNNLAFSHMELDSTKERPFGPSNPEYL